MYEQKLEVLNKQLIKTLHEKDSYLSRISHELRTPLNAIHGFAQLLQYTDDIVEAKDYSNNILKNSNLLLNLVNEVLEISNL